MNTTLGKWPMFLRLLIGLELTDQPEQADVLLINTCSVREKAQEKLFSELGRWRPLKNSTPPCNYWCRWMRSQSRRRCHC